MEGLVGQGVGLPWGPTLFRLSGHHHPFLGEPARLLRAACGRLSGAPCLGTQAGRGWAGARVPGKAALRLGLRSHLRGCGYTSFCCLPWSRRRQVLGDV